MALEATQSSPVTAQRAGKQQHRSLGQRLRRALPLYAVLLPPFLGLLIFDYDPVALAIYLSFFEWGIGLPAKWIGLENYVRMFTDAPTFTRSLKNIAIITAWVVFQATVIPLIVAELIFAVRSLRLKFAFRIGMVLP